MTDRTGASSRAVLACVAVALITVSGRSTAAEGDSTPQKADAGVEHWIEATFERPLSAFDDVYLNNSKLLQEKPQTHISGFDAKGREVNIMGPERGYLLNTNLGFAVTRIRIYWDLRPDTEGWGQTNRLGTVNVLYQGMKVQQTENIVAGISRKPIVAAPKPEDVEAFLARVSWATLAEVTGLDERDNRPGDGSLDLLVHLNAVRGSGNVPKTARFVMAHGGLGPEQLEHRPGGKTAEPVLSFGGLLPGRWGAFEKGRRYWFVGGYSGTAWWPDDGSSAAGAIDEVVRRDAYEWRPVYVPDEDLSFGHKDEPEKGLWRIRVTRGTNTLWAADIPGNRPEVAGVTYPVHQLTVCYGCGHCGKTYLWAQSVVSLKEPNEFNLVSNTYYVSYNYCWDDGGLPQSVGVRRFQPSDVPLLSREFDKAGDLVKEEVTELGKSELRPKADK